MEVLAPFARRLRVAALGYAEAHAAFAADIVDLGNAKDADLDKLATRGCIGVLSPTTALQTSEIVAMAVARGLRAVLFINREGGGQLLARTGSFRARRCRYRFIRSHRRKGDGCSGSWRAVRRCVYGWKRSRAVARWSRRICDSSCRVASFRGS